MSPSSSTPHFPRARPVLTSLSALYASLFLTPSRVCSLLSSGAMREPSSLPDGIAAVCKYQAALPLPCFPGDYRHCINTEVLSTTYTQTTHHHKTHTHTYTLLPWLLETVFTDCSSGFLPLYFCLADYSHPYRRYALTHGKICPLCLHVVAA